MDTTLIQFAQDHKFGITVYVVIHLLTYFLFVHILGKPHVKHHDNPAFEKYKAFARTDVNNWSVIWSFPFYITFWLRCAVCCINLLYFTTFVLTCMIGTSSDHHDIGKVRRLLISSVGKYSCRLHCLMVGLYWVNYDHVSTAEGDYSKWLGPDWKPQWSGAGTIVSNHVCWMDIVIALSYMYPSFVSKASVASYPGIGTIAKAIDCVFIHRAGSKEEKIKVAQMIEDRQKENELTGRSSILIYPEGATTNNRQVIQFKRGPFSGLHSVQPLGLKYWSLNGISPQNDTVSAGHFFFGSMSAFTHLHMKIYPVFKPNKYFWDNHWDEKSGEKQWEAYARVIRQIIASSHDFPLSDATMEDKLEYKLLIKDKKPKQKTQ